MDSLPMPDIIPETAPSWLDQVCGSGVAAPRAPCSPCGVFLHRPKRREPAPAGSGRRGAPGPWEKQAVRDRRLYNLSAPLERLLDPDIMLEDLREEAQ